MSKSITLGGRRFKSMNAAARALGYCDGKYLADIINKGGKRAKRNLRNRIEALPPEGSAEMPSVRPPCVIRGVEYPSMAAAARDLGVSRQAVWAAIEAGNPDRVGRAA